MLRYRLGRCVVTRVLLRETKFYAVGVFSLVCTPASRSNTEGSAQK